LKEQLLSDLFNSTDLDEERIDKIKKELEVYEDDYRNYPLSVYLAQRKIETDLENIVKETMSKIYTIKEEEEEPASSNQPNVDEAHLLMVESVQDDNANWPEVFDFPNELLKRNLIQKLENLKGPLTKVDLKIVTKAIVDKIRSCGEFYPSHHQYLQAAKSFIDFYPNIKPKSSEKTQIFTKAIARKIKLCLQNLRKTAKVTATTIDEENSYDESILNISTQSESSTFLSQESLFAAEEE
jgi:hypothetical protein